MCNGLSISNLFLIEYDSFQMGRIHVNDLINISHIYIIYFQSPRGLFCNKIRESEQKTEASEFIDLHFEKPVFVNAVYVYETLNPGSIVEIWAGKFHFFTFDNFLS